MYQVLFAEDELLVRLGLQNSIDWKAYDMELAAQADNGLQAYELFQKVRPDVVITDIRMEDGQYDQVFFCVELPLLLCSFSV